MTEPPSEPKVSVIIPVKDDEERLRGCLAALEQQDYAGDVEILIVDNGSRRPPSVSGFHADILLLAEPNPGSYAARNTGIDRASGEVLAFTDSDCVPEDGWLREGVAALRRGTRRGFVGGRVEVFATDPASPTTAELYDLAVAFPQRQYVERGGYAVTANLIVRANDLRDVGPFDSRLQSSGDREWGRRATASGVPGVYSESAAVRHPARRSVSEISSKHRRILEGRVDLARSESRPFGIAEAVQLFVFPVGGLGRGLHRLRGHSGFRRTRFVALYLFLHYRWALGFLRRAATQRLAGREPAGTQPSTPDDHRPESSP